MYLGIWYRYRLPTQDYSERIKLQDQIRVITVSSFQPPEKKYYVILHSDRTFTYYIKQKQPLEKMTNSSYKLNIY